MIPVQLPFHIYFAEIPIAKLLGATVRVQLIFYRVPSKAAFVAMAMKRAAHRRPCRLVH